MKKQKQQKICQIVKNDDLFQAVDRTGKIIASRKDEAKLTSYMVSAGWEVADEFAPMPEKPSFNVAQRFDFMEKAAKMVALGIVPSSVISGASGMGKSYTIMQVVKNAMLVEHRDFIKIKGFITPKALYRILYEWSDKLIVLDDIDSIYRNENSMNLLKGALDSDKVRKISWLAEGAKPEDLPDSFDFKGRCIFITNRDKDDIEEALVTRSVMVNVSMTNVEKVTRIEEIIDSVRPDDSMDVKLEVLDFLKENNAHSETLSIRTFERLVDVRKTFPDDWKDAALYFLSNE